MKKVRNQPITGATPQWSKKAPLVPDAKETSANAQTMIAEAPTPFKNNQTTANLPAGSKASGGVSTLEPKIASGLRRTTPGARALPQRGPIGQKKPINQSGQIGGHMGFPPPARKAGVNGTGFKAKKGAAFYGE